MHMDAAPLQCIKYYNNCVADKKFKYLKGTTFSFMFQILLLSKWGQIPVLTTQKCIGSRRKVTFKEIYFHKISKARRMTKH